MIQENRVALQHASQHLFQLLYKKKISPRAINAIKYITGKAIRQTMSTFFACADSSTKSRLFTMMFSKTDNNMIRNDIDKNVSMNVK